MPATPDREPPPLQDDEPSSLSFRFWHLADNTGEFTELREPVAVVRHAVAAIRALQGDAFDATSSDSLAFVMGLDGNPRYSSPEQRRGAAESSQSLVYSLGVLLFERLTGYHPFDDSVRRASSGGRQLCHVPTDLRGILHRALAPFPEDRYPDADAFRRALEGHLRNEASRHRRPHTSPAPAPGSTARKMLKALRAPTEVDDPAGPAPANKSQLNEILRAPTDVEAPAPAPLPVAAMRLTTERDESPAGLAASAASEPTDVDPTMFVTPQRRGALESLVRRWPVLQPGVAFARTLPTRIKDSKSLEALKNLRNVRSWQDLGTMGVGPVPAWIAAALLLFVAVIIWASAGDPQESTAARNQVVANGEARARAGSPAPRHGATPRDAERAPAPRRQQARETALGRKDTRAEETTLTGAPAPIRVERAAAGTTEPGAKDEAPAPPSPAAVFDAELAGERAAHAAADCLSDLKRRRLAIGVTFRFAPDGSTDKVFFGRLAGLRNGERRCLVRRLQQIHGGGPTPRRTVTYTLRFPAGRPVYRIDG